MLALLFQRWDDTASLLPATARQCRQARRWGGEPPSSPSPSWTVYRHVAVGARWACPSSRPWRLFRRTSQTACRICRLLQIDGLPSFPCKLHFTDFSNFPDLKRIELLYEYITYVWDIFSVCSYLDELLVKNIKKPIRAYSVVRMHIHSCSFKPPM